MHDIFEVLRASVSDLMTNARSLTFAEIVDLERTDATSYRAIESALSEIGDAADMLPDEVKERHDKVDWHFLVGLGGAIAQVLRGAEGAVTWTVVDAILPHLETAIDEEIGPLPVMGA